MGRKFSPILDRMKSYEEMRRLVTEGISRPTVIVRELRAAGFNPPSRQTIRRWSLDETSPYTGKLMFVPRPSEELSFFVGAWLGDGWGDENDGGKRMRLKVRSESFATEFASAASFILSKPNPYGVWTTADDGGYWYNVKVTSFMLHDFITQDFEDLKAKVEAFPRGFLRGFATAEGCPSVSLSKRRGPRLDVGVVISNSDLPLLEFSRELLVRLGIHPGKIRLNMSEGAKTNVGVATKNGWLLNISRLDEVQRFADLIGFADLEKQQKLKDALRMVREFGHVGGGRRWPKLYEKVRKEWVKRKLVS